MPTLRQLEYLAALAETGRFRQAAERVGVRQPTLSAQLAALEERLGVRLVERNRGSVRLTEAGQEALTVARRILADVDEMRALAAARRRDFEGVIRLGSPPTVGPYLLPRVIPALHRAYPRLRLHLREQTPQRLSEALAFGEHDLILTPLPVASGDLDSAPIYREPLLLAVAADHRFARAAKATREDLDGEPVLALERGHQLHEQVEALCEEFGARLLHDYAGASLETLAQMVALGMGASFLPATFFEAGPQPRAGLVAVELEGRRLSRTIGAAWRSGDGRSAERRALIAFLRSAAAEGFSSLAPL